MFNTTPNFKIKSFIIGASALMCSLSASALDVKVDADCVEEDKTVVTAATLQEAGDIDWKLWNAVVPVDAGGGFSTVLGYKILRKANFEGTIRKFIKKNSNNTYELTGRFTGITEELSLIHI